MPSWNDNSANLPDRETAIRAELAASGGGTLNSILASGNDASGKTITGLGGPSLASDAATKSYVDSAVTLSTILSTNNDAGTSTITNLGTPSLSTDAATKGYVDTHAGASETLASVLGNGNDANALKITNLATPSLASDAATKNYVDTTVSGAAAHSLSQVLAVGADANATTIKNAGAPSALTDVATKGYVDGLTPNTVSATTYTFASTDIGKIVIFTSATGCTATIPLGLGDANICYEIHLKAGAAAGTITIAAAGGVTLVNPYTSFSLVGANARATIMCYGANAWTLNGEVA